MSAIMKKITRNPAFPTIMAATSYTILTAISAVCLFIYFTQMAKDDFWHWQLIPYLFMLANGISGFSEFVNEESFCPLRDLLDYCQVVLVLPCYAAQMWVKTETGPPEIAAIHAGLGIMAALMYIVYESRRQDLTDLAIFANSFSLMCVAVLSANPLTFVATSIFLSCYCVFKREDDQCCLAPLDKFNLAMAAFGIFSLASFDDEIIQAIQDNVKSVLAGGK